MLWFSCQVGAVPLTIKYEVRKKSRVCFGEMAGGRLGWYPRLAPIPYRLAVAYGGGMAVYGIGVSLAYHAPCGVGAAPAKHVEYSGPSFGSQPVLDSDRLGDGPSRNAFIYVPFSYAIVIFLYTTVNPTPDNSGIVMQISSHPLPGGRGGLYTLFLFNEVFIFAFRWGGRALDLREGG